MKKRALSLGLWMFGLIIILSLSMVTILSGQSSLPDSGEILKTISARQGLSQGSYVMDLKITSINDKEKSTAKLKVYLYDSTKKMVTFTEPVRLKDSSYLVIDFNTWMFQRGLKRPIRISAQQKLFGDAGIAETVGINYTKHYTITESSANNDSYILKLKANDPRAAYQQVEIWTTRGDEPRIQKVILKALNGNPMKELIYDNYRLLNEHQVSTITVTNLLLKKDYKTVIDFINIEGKKLPAEAFDPLMMSKFNMMVN